MKEITFFQRDVNHGGITKSAPRVTFRLCTSDGVCCASDPLPVYSPNGYQEYTMSAVYMYCTALCFKVSLSLNINGKNITHGESFILVSIRDHLFLLSEITNLSCLWGPISKFREQLRTPCN